MNPAVRLAPARQTDSEDLAAIEDLPRCLLTILLAQPDADIAVNQMHRVASLIVCHARAIQSRQAVASGRIIMATEDELQAAIHKAIAAGVDPAMVGEAIVYWENIEDMVAVLREEMPDLLATFGLGTTRS